MPDGGLSGLNLEQYDDGYDRLSSHLLYDILIGPGTVLQHDGSMFRTIEYRGKDRDSAELEELVYAVDHLNGVLAQFNTGYSLLFEKQRRKARNLPLRRIDNDAPAMVEQENYEDVSTTTYVNRSFLTITYSPPPMESVSLERFFQTNPPERAETDFFREHVVPFTKLTNILANIFAGQMAWAKVLTSDELVTYLHSCLSPHDHPVEAPTEAGWPLEQVFEEIDFVSGSFPHILDHKANWHVRTVSVLGYPKSSNPMILDALNNLGFEYRYCLRFNVLSKLHFMGVMKEIWQRRKDNEYGWRQIAQKVIDRQSQPEPDPIAVAHTMEAQNARHDADDDAMGSGFLTVNLTVWSQSIEGPDGVDAKVDKVLEVFRGRGFASRVETANAWRAWMSSLPGEHRANLRKRPLPSIHPVHMVRISDVWPGPPSNMYYGGPPLMTLKTAESMPFSFDLHWGNVGHAVLVGPARTGKSTLLARIAYAFHQFGDVQIFWGDVDANRSTSTAATLAAGGDVMTFGRDQFALQPFAEIDDPEELTYWTGWTLSTLKRKNFFTRSKISESQAENLVKEALSDLGDEPVERRTISMFVALTQDDEIRQALAQFVGDGIFAAMMDANEDRISNSHWVTFELSMLTSMKEEAAPIVRALIHKITRRIIQAHAEGKRSLFILDEAWKVLGNAELAEEVGELLRRLPKHDAQIVFAVHTLHDLERTGIAPLLAELCHTHIFLANPQAKKPSGMRVLEHFGMGESQAHIIAGMQAKRDLYIVRPDGARLCHMFLGPYAKTFCANGADEANEVQDLIRTHGKAGFRDALLQARGLAIPSNQNQGPITDAA